MDEILAQIFKYTHRHDIETMPNAYTTYIHTYIQAACVDEILAQIRKTVDRHDIETMPKFIRLAEAGNEALEEVRLQVYIHIL